MGTSFPIQTIIAYIENNITDTIELEPLAQRFGYSKYYFHRLFKQRINMNLYQYILRRRLIQACKLLIYSDLKIIDIALMLQFNSHEAFTRSFQKNFNQSPFQYRHIMRNFINNKEETNMESPITGWTFSALDIDQYTIEKDFNISNQSQFSIKLSSLKADIDPNLNFCNFFQTFKAKNYFGKRMKFSAFVKSEAVTGWSGLWMRIDDHSFNMLGFDNMSNRPIKDTTDWNYYSCVLDVPYESTNINFGLILAGSGTVWLDSCSFIEVEKTVPVTDIRLVTEDLLDHPINLSFE